MVPRKFADSKIRFLKVGVALCIPNYKQYETFLILKWAWHTKEAERLDNVSYYNNRLVGMAPHNLAGSYRHEFVHTNCNTTDKCAWLQAFIPISGSWVASGLDYDVFIHFRIIQLITCDPIWVRPR